jgi:hypothetical protein
MYFFSLKKKHPADPTWPSYPSTTTMVKYMLPSVKNELQKLSSKDSSLLIINDFSI